MVIPALSDAQRAMMVYGELRKPETSAAMPVLLVADALARACRAKHVSLERAIIAVKIAFDVNEDPNHDDQAK